MNWFLAQSLFSILAAFALGVLIGYLIWRLHYRKVVTTVSRSSTSGSSFLASGGDLDVNAGDAADGQVASIRASLDSANASLHQSRLDHEREVQGLRGQIASLESAAAAARSASAVPVAPLVSAPDPVLTKSLAEREATLRERDASIASLNADLQRARAEAQSAQAAASQATAQVNAANQAASQASSQISNQLNAQIETLRAGVQERDTRLASLATELERVRVGVSDAATAQKAEAQQAAQTQLNTRINALAAEHDTKLTSVKAEHDKQVVVVRSEYEKQISTLTAQHEQALATSRSGHEHALADLRRRSESAEAELAKARLELDQVRLAGNRVQQERDVEVQRLVSASGSAERDRDTARAELAAVLETVRRSELSLAEAQAGSKANSDQVVNLTRDLESVRSEQSSVRSQLDASLRQVSTLTAERDGVQSQLAALRSSQDELRTQHQALTGQHDTLQARHNTLVSEHDALRGTHASLQGEHGLLRDTHASLQGEHGSLRDRFSALEGDHRAVSGELSAIREAELNKPDDLLRIEGIGPAFNRSLAAGGITTFAQLRDTDDDSLRAVLQKSGHTFAPSLPTWSKQAGYLAARDEEGWKAYTQYLIAGQDPSQWQGVVGSGSASGSSSSSGPASAQTIRTPSTSSTSSASSSVSPASVDRSVSSAAAASGDGTSLDAHGDDPEGFVDDLERIEGIGPRISAALQSSGIRTFRRLSVVSDERLRAALARAGLNLAPSLPTWANQARFLASGDEAGFRALVDRLIAGREPK